MVSLPNGARVGNAGGSAGRVNGEIVLSGESADLWEGLCGRGRDISTYVPLLK